MRVGAAVDYETVVPMWGIDRLRAGQLPLLRRRLQGSKVAVLTHGPAVDEGGLNVLQVLELSGIAPVVLFTPEHGFDGIEQAEEGAAERVASLSFPRPAPASETQNGDDGDRAAPGNGLSRPPLERVVSLYGSTKQSLSPRDEDLSGIDVLLIDLVDIGTRCYTYIWTALLAARAAQRNGVHTLVLDRPNPISGDPRKIEGAPQTEDYLSFVGLEPLPLRHSLTLGEILCHFFARAEYPLGQAGALSVISVRGWERTRTASSWKVPFSAPSPNMPTVETALVYPGGCLLEGTNLSEGRGTTLPFQAIGAPFVDAERLAADMARSDLPGFVARPLAFRPMFDKHAQQVCRGVLLRVTDAERFRPVATYLTLITLVRAQVGAELRFLDREYEFETNRLAFDLLTGSTRARVAIESGAAPSDVVDLVCPVEAGLTDLVANAERLAIQARA